MDIIKKIPIPSKAEIIKYLNKWDSLENYVLQENSLDKLFFKTYPNNDDINDILIKARFLNDFYSTNIFSIFSVSKHILSLNIDSRLKECDELLVNDIANVEINGKKKNFYSFATKYCSHHNPINFPIYDSYVEKVLVYFNKKYKFSNFKKSDLKDIDKYLWQLCKEYFPKKY